MRAHRDLLISVPEPTERNHVIWEAWSAAFGDTERQRADVRFAKTQYEKKPDVCYFSEHETSSTGADGQPMVRRYDATKLREIIDENNGRIADVDAYPTIIDRHTAPSGTRDPSPPETLGVAGPLRLGMIGRLNPRFAIFADEYVRRDKLAKIADKGGRSVEVLTQKSTGKSYLNPIAAISEAPRLPLPVQFSFGHDSDEIVERYTAIAPYSMTAAAFPSGGNTHHSQFGKPDNDSMSNYASDENSPDSQNPSQPPTEPAMQGNEQLVRQIIDGIMNTEQMQWVSQQMTAGGTPTGGAEPTPQTPPTQNANPSPAPAGGPSQQFGGGGSPMQRYDVEGEDEMTTERYQALVDGQQQLVNELAASNSRVAQLEVSKADAERSSRLRELASRVPINLDSELDRCLYSAGSSMDDDRFDDHFDTIEMYAAKAIEQMPMVPTGVMPKNKEGDRETAKYQAQESSLIRTLHNDYVNQGIVKSYPELKAEAKQQLAS